MNLSLKKILKQLDVLFVSELDTSYKKIENILHLFFKDIFHTNSLLYAKEIYEKYVNAKNIQFMHVKGK